MACISVSNFSGAYLDQLVHEAFDCRWVKRTVLSVIVHILLEIFVHKLENKHQLIVCVNNIPETDNVFVLQLLHKRDLSYRCTGRSFFAVQVNFFESDSFSRAPVLSFIHCRICSLA